MRSSAFQLCGFRLRREAMMERVAYGEALLRDTSLDEKAKESVNTSGKIHTR